MSNTNFGRGGCVDETLSLIYIWEKYIMLILQYSMKQSKTYRKEYLSFERVIYSTTVQGWYCPVREECSSSFGRLFDIILNSDYR